MPKGVHHGHVRGAAHHRWNPGRIVTPHGYVLVRVEPGHHLRMRHGYAYEHALVAEAKLGRELAPGEIVHHVNGKRSDNRPENITVIRRGEHWHNRGRDPVTGRFTSGPRPGGEPGFPGLPQQGT